MKKMRFFWTATVIGGIHFLACLLIVPLTLRAGDYFMGSDGARPVLAVLHLATRVLYFPVIGLALYPRHWFPGPWITVPILVNSLLWGAFLSAIVRLAASFGAKRQPESDDFE